VDHLSVLVYSKHRIGQLIEQGRYLLSGTPLLLQKSVFSHLACKQTSHVLNEVLVALKPRKQPFTLGLIEA